MNQYLLIGIAAGLCAALLNLSGYSGGMVGLGFLLVLASTLPIMIATLGWGSFTGLISVAASGVALALLVGVKAGFFFMLLNSLPAWWIAHLTGLFRMNSETGETVWYPIDRLLVWIASIASATTMAMFIPFGFSLETYQDAIAKLMNQLYSAKDLTAPDGTAMDLEVLISIISRLAPTASSIMLVLTAVVTLYFAGKIAQKSGRLTRPWPDLHQVTMPAWTALVFIAGLVGLFMGGLFGVFAQIIASSFGCALLLVGLSVLHYLTRNNSSRIALLWTAYFLLIIFQWLGLFLMILGASEILINIRSRLPQGPGSGSGQSGSQGPTT